MLDSVGNQNKDKVLVQEILVWHLMQRNHFLPLTVPTLNNLLMHLCLCLCLSLSLSHLLVCLIYKTLVLAAVTAVFYYRRII